MDIVVAGLVIVVLLGIAGFLGLRAWAASAPRPSTVNTGALAPCPSSPNCVSSLSAGGYPQASPWTFQGSAEGAQARLRRIIEQMPNTRIVTDRPGYLYAEFRTPMIGFIDDVEFTFDAQAQRIDFRSASRLGRADAGVNLARIESLAAAFNRS